MTMPTVAEAIEAFVCSVAMSIPPSDFGSDRAIKAMAAAIEQRDAAIAADRAALVEALRRIEHLCKLCTRDDTGYSVLTEILAHARAALATLPKPEGE